MDCYEDEIARLSKQRGDRTLGEMEEELGINHYDNTGVGFGYLGLGKLPETHGEAMKIFDPAEIDELLKV